ncbi:biliverdin-producing heme oxygenase [Terriglobus saanensis]|uniref:Heme oxygenase-like protein n=1 Tax=Terriglobus saanensis (strain ATCC BAA-1853 / DSM 23119 / SP1PR4) TaxID=401053 RepID=E8V8N6_TERSS|nr:biliverdin-producing heme oxygenase [Terriglobus saanensis]ADV84073.1 heme oxygenase-like protein [Terriglobus saanensis SP1PR4]
MDPLRLREATADLHAQTEEGVPLMKPDLTLTEYVSVLQRFYRAVAAWETWAETHVPEQWRAMFEQRRRSRLLLEDFHSLGVTSDEAAWSELPFPVLESDASFLGAMYVVEGSTLGGQYIARHVEEVLQFTPGVGDAYFRGYGDRTGEMWKEFRAVVAGIDDRDSGEVIDGARKMFGMFAHCLKEGQTVGA